jgi:hypothetical protein
MVTKTKGFDEHINSLDLSILSDQAQGELVDFYYFLLERYGRQQPSPRSLPPIFYQPIKTRRYHPFKREDIYDAR